MKKIILLIFVQFSLYSQQNSFFGFNDYGSITQNPIIINNNRNFSLNDLVGSIYNDDDFIMGSVVDLKNNRESNLYLRYDVYKDLFEIILEKSSKDIKTLERAVIYQYKYKGEKFTLIEDNNLNIYHYNTGNAYLVEVFKESEDFVLYKRYVKQFIEGKKATSSYDADKKPQLKDEVIYVLNINNAYKKLELNKKEILSSFDEKSHGKLKEFIKKNKLKFKGSGKEIETQLIQLVKHYTTIK